MSDWELISDQDSSGNPSSGDWELAPQSSPQSQVPATESLLGAAVKAPFRVGADVLGGAYNLAKNIPNYWESAKTEVPGLLTSLQHPGHAGLQALAGLTEAGRNIANLPSDIARYGANRLNLLPQSVSNKLQNFRSPLSDQDINNIFGNPEQPGENLLRGIGRNVVGLGAANKLLKSVYDSPLSYKNIANDVLNTQKANKEKYSKLYNNIWDEASKKGVNNLSSITPFIDMESIRKYSPSKSIVGLEKFAEEPTLENAHRAKSDLLGIQRKLEKITSYNTGEAEHARSISNAINTINNNMFKDKSGALRPDLVDLADRYRNIQQGYASEVVPYSNKAINSFKRGEISPKKLVNTLANNEFIMKRGEAHPNISRRLKLNPLLKHLGIGALIGTGIEGARALTGGHTASENP